MAITDSLIISFSDTQIRLVADKLVTLYYECRKLKELKVADASTSTTIANRTPLIRSVSDYMVSVVQGIRHVENIWNNVGTPQTLAAATPNSAVEVLQDDAVLVPDGRLIIDGADIHNAVNRVIDIRKWMADAVFGGDGLGTSFNAMLDTMVTCGSSGNDPLIVSQVDSFVDDRCTQIKNEYEATSFAKLEQLKAISPNWRNPA